MLRWIKLVLGVLGFLVLAALFIVLMAFKEAYTFKPHYLDSVEISLRGDNEFYSARCASVGEVVDHKLTGNGVDLYKVKVSCFSVEQKESFELLWVKQADVHPRR